MVHTAYEVDFVNLPGWWNGRHRELPEASMFEASMFEASKLEEFLVARREGSSPSLGNVQASGPSIKGFKESK